MRVPDVPKVEAYKEGREERRCIGIGSDVIRV